jgi:ABC-2 type transport system ATP-binding protein
MNAIHISALHKSYNTGKEVLHGMDLSIPKGQFFGLLGPNGAGKTTTISCITGVSQPTSGTIQVLGHDVVSDYRAARGCIGVSPQEFTVDMFQSVEEILDYAGGFYGMRAAARKARVEEMLDQFELQPHRRKSFRFLSGGLKRRVVVAKALMHDPSVIILDEPTAGVDVETRRELWEYLRKLHQSGKTIILTSHYLEEVEALCERVAIINQGAIILDDTMTNLTQVDKLEDVYLKAIQDDGGTDKNFKD